MGFQCSVSSRATRGVHNPNLQVVIMHYNVMTNFITGTCHVLVIKFVTY